MTCRRWNTLMALTMQLSTCPSCMSGATCFRVIFSNWRFLLINSNIEKLITGLVKIWIWSMQILFNWHWLFVGYIPVQNLKSQLVQRVRSVQSDHQSTNEDDSAMSHKLRRSSSEDTASRVRLAQLLPNVISTSAGALRGLFRTLIKSINSIKLSFHLIC